MGAHWDAYLAKTGNELGLGQQELEGLAADDLEPRLAGARQRLVQSGAHFVVDGISDVPQCLEQIESRLARGEKP